MLLNRILPKYYIYNIYIFINDNLLDNFYNTLCLLISIIHNTNQYFIILLDKYFLFDEKLYVPKCYICILFELDRK